MVNGLEMKMRRLALLTCIGLSGCITVTESNVATLGIVDLCTARIVARNVGDQKGAELALAEIQRRGGFSSAELQAIQVNQVFVGMSETAGLCAWGGAYDTINTTATASGVMKQYVYSGSEFSKARYLYATSGRISGFQT